MKKSLLATAMAAAMVLSTSVVLAAPGDVTVDGTVFTQYRNNSGVKSDHKEGGKTAVIVNAHDQLSDNWSVYARLATEGASTGADFKQGSAYSADTQYVAALDQFGFNYKQDDTTATIGRQAVWIGSTGLLYDTTGYLGRKYFADGVNFASKSGNFSYQVTAAQEDVAYNTTSASKNKIYAAHVDYAATDNFTIGATYGQYKYGDTNQGQTAKVVGFTNWNQNSAQNFNFSAINASYNFGQAALHAELAKTNLSQQNHSYAYGVSYKFDDANSASVYYYKVEDNGDINGNTTFDNGYKGFYYSYSHNFSKNITGSLFYKDSKTVDTSEKNRSFRATLSYNF